MKSIKEQLNIFLNETNFSARRLAMLAGVSPVDICRVRRGTRRDMGSRRADALREAMWELDPEAAEKALGHGRPT